MSNKTISEKVDLLIKNSGTPELAISYLIGFTESLDLELNAIKENLGMKRSDKLEELFDSIEAKNAK